METYSVRSKEGALIARIVGAPAEDIFKILDGEWRTYDPEDDKRTVCYEIERDSVWESSTYHGAFQIFLWAGTIIIKD